MGAIDDFYDEVYARRNERNRKYYDSIIKSFEDLSLEEKVNKLIEIYAREQAYN